MKGTTVKKLLAGLVATSGILAAQSALAVWPLPPYTVYPCLLDPNNCFSCRSFGEGDFQIQRATRSSRSNPAYPIAPYGICLGPHDWCQLPPQLGSVTTQQTTAADGTRALLFMVPYDFPNNYCQVQGTDVTGSCGASIWPIQIQGTTGHLTKLEILSGSNMVAQTLAIFENGLWMPTVPFCSGTGTFTVVATNMGNLFADCGSPISDTQTVTVTIPATPQSCAKPDKMGCPSCNEGSSGGGGGVGKPINVGSGDVGFTEPLFTLSQQPVSLGFALAYHSEPPVYPNLPLPNPLGTGWTHTFNQTLLPVDPNAVLLHHRTAAGWDNEYRLVSDGTWAAYKPGELRGTVTKDAATSRYLLTDLDGTVTAFDVGSGRWLSTTDRWGNAITGSYTGADLTAITDAMGRQVTLSYTAGQLTQVSTPTGQTWRFGYTAGNLTQVFDPLHTGTTPWKSFTYQPDSQGILRLLTGVRDEAGTLLEGHTYDAQDRGITSASEASRDLVTIEYDVPGPDQRRVTHTIDQTSAQVSIFTLTYQKGRYLPLRIDGNCATCSGGGDDTQSFTWDDSNHLSSHTDGNGHVTTYGYNGDGNLVSRTEAKGTARERTTTYTYGYAPWPNFRTQITQPSGAKPGAQKVTAMTWNASGAPETTLTSSESGYLLATDTTATTYTSVTTFDARHRLIAIDGPRTDVADVTTRTYYPDNDATLNRRGRLKSATDPVGLTSLYDDYDVFGTPRSVTDPNGVLTTKVTDDKGRVRTSTSKAVTGDPNETVDYVTTYTFDGRDRLSESTLPRGNRLRYGYEDGTNRLTDTTRVDLAGNEMERRHLTLNTIGDRVVEEDQACSSPASTCGSWVTKRSESYLFDAHNRLSQTVHPVPQGSKVVYTYDHDGLLLATQDENHASPNTVDAYDALDRLVSVTQTLATAPGGVIATTYAYDVLDDLTSVTDPNGNVTLYAYDDFRRLQKQTSPVSGLTTYGYDPAGNLVSSTDSRGATTIRTYDPANRLLSATSTLTASPTETVTYTYDDPTPGRYGKGRLATMSDPSGSTSFRYERRGLLAQESRTILGDSYATSFRYDPNGNRAGLTYPSGRSLTYGFDFADRPQNLTGIFNALTTTDRKSVV